MNDRATARAAWCAIETLVLFALHAPVFVSAVRAHIGKSGSGTLVDAHPRRSNVHPGVPIRIQRTGVHSQICFSAGRSKDRFCSRLSELIAAPPDNLRNLGK
jgi:hypothetical protein